MSEPRRRHRSRSSPLSLPAAWGPYTLNHLMVIYGRWGSASSSVTPSQLALYLGRWVEDATPDTLPPDASVIVQQRIPGRPVRRAFEWKERPHVPKERWYLLGPMEKAAGSSRAPER